MGLIHSMGLYNEYFTLIQEQKKTVEVRLYDEKRRKIALGDKIEFISLPDQSKTLQVEVVGLTKYDTFKEMFTDIPSEKLGGENWTLEEMIDGMYKIYSPEQEQRWGTIAITIK